VESEDTAFSPRSRPDDGRAHPSRRLRDAIEPLATLGYHAPVALDPLAEAGLEHPASYVWPRASSLGEPSAAVVVSAFGVWQPAAITAAFESGRAAVGLEEVRRLRLRGATDAVRAVLGEPDDVDGLEDTVVALERAVAGTSTVARPIFAGLTGHPQPPDLLGRLWHVTNEVRERRGDAHLAALAGAGVDGVEANLLNELWHGFDLFSFTGTRFWTQEQMDAGLGRLRDRGLVDGEELTDRGRSLREVLESFTDASEEVVTDRLHDVDRHVGRLERWSQQVVERGWYPDEGNKRYAG